METRIPLSVRAVTMALFLGTAAFSASIQENAGVHARPSVVLAGVAAVSIEAAASKTLTDETLTDERVQEQSNRHERRLPGAGIFPALDECIEGQSFTVIAPRYPAMEGCYSTETGAGRVPAISGQYVYTSPGRATNGIVGDYAIVALDLGNSSSGTNLRWVLGFSNARYSHDKAIVYCVSTEKLTGLSHPSTAKWNCDLNGKQRTSLTTPAASASRFELTASCGCPGPAPAILDTRGGMEQERIKPTGDVGDPPTRSRANRFFFSMGIAMFFMFLLGTIVWKLSVRWKSGNIAGFLVTDNRATAKISTRHPSFRRQASVSSSSSVV